MEGLISQGVYTSSEGVLGGLINGGTYIPGGLTHLRKASLKSFNTHVEALDMCY